MIAWLLLLTLTQPGATPDDLFTAARLNGHRAVARWLLEHGSRGAETALSVGIDDGRLYFASEDGDVFVARAGAEYVELGKRAMNEVIMATPAISDGVIVIRTLGHLYAIGEPAK